MKVNHYLRGISISIFYHSPGTQVYWCFILTESHFLDGSISDWKKKSKKKFRLMFGCLVLMEPVNHSYAVPSFSFRDSNREEKLSGTLSLVYHWPSLRFKTRQKPSAKKKDQKQNNTEQIVLTKSDDDSAIVMLFRLQFKGKRSADENVQFLMKFMNNLLNFQINLDHTSYLSHALHVMPVWNIL